MKNCVYCGKEISKVQYKARAITRKFPTCSVGCQSNTEKYVQMDSKYKTLMYLMLFATGIGVLFTVVFLNTNMKILYLLNIVAGMTFLTLPYPITSFETFNYCPIATVKKITRMVGLAFSLFGLYLILAL